MSNIQAQQQAPHPIVQFKRDLDAVVSKELGVLDDKGRERMRSAAIVAVTKDPELLLADRQSFMSELRRCANYGVVPDGVQAVLQVYNTKVKDANGQEIWIKKVTLLPMIRGIIERVQRSGKVHLFYAEVVYDKETFKIDTTQGDRRPVHEYDPMRRGDDKDIIGAYSVAVYKDGVTDCEPMPRDQIEKVKAVAKTKNVWDGWFTEKAKVAVMKRHAKRLPLSADDLEFILNRDESDFTQMRDVTPEKPDYDNRTTLAQRIMGHTPAVDPEKAAPPAESAQDGDVRDGEVLPPDDGDAAPVDAPDVSGAFPGSPEWDEGVEAFKAGKNVGHCPYDLAAEKEKATDWLGGWNGAKEEAAR